MRRRNIIRIAIFSVVLTGAFLVLRSASPAGKSKPCKESMDECSKQKSSDKAIWENVSQQFFSSI